MSEVPRVYLVTYAPISNGGEYATVCEWLEENGGVEVAHFFGWIIASALSPNELRDTLLALVLNDAEIVVAEVTKGNVAISDRLTRAQAIVAEYARFVPRRG